MKRSFLGSILACLFFLSIVLVYSCRKQELSADDGLVSEDLLESAQEWHKTQTEAAFTLSKGNKKKKKKKILAPLWNAARLERSPEGKQVLVVPASDYPVGNKELAAFRTFVFTEKGGEVAGGRIVEVFGDPEYIASHRRELSGKTGSREIKGFNGVILQYDVNYRRIEGSRYVNGKQDDKNQVRIAKRKPGFDKKGGFFDKKGGNKVMTEEWENPQPGCEYYFLVIINLWTGQITWWEYLGKWCEDDWGDNPWGDEGGGGGDPPPSDGCYSCQGGGPPPPPLREIKTDDPSITSHSKTSCILGMLGENNRAYDKFLDGFLGTAQLNVTFKRADVIPALPGHTPNASTKKTPGSANIDIWVRTGFVDGSPSWEVAKSLVHEMAHAYIASRIWTIGGPGNLSQHLDNTEFKHLFDYYSKHVNPTTGTWSATENNSAEHAAMAGLLINDIARGIEDYCKQNNPDIVNNSLITFDNYKAAAWIGLEDTDSYTVFKNDTGETDYSQALKYNALTSNVSSCSQ